MQKVNKQYNNTLQRLMFSRLIAHWTTRTGDEWFASGHPAKLAVSGYNSPEAKAHTNKSTKTWVYISIIQRNKSFVLYSFFLSFFIINIL